MRRQGRSRPRALNQRARRPRNERASAAKAATVSSNLDFGFSTGFATLHYPRMPPIPNRNSDAGNPKPITLYTAALTSDQAKKLRTLLEADDFRFEPKPYTLYYASKDKLNVAVYKKGPMAFPSGIATAMASSPGIATGSRSRGKEVTTCSTSDGHALKM